MSKRKSDTLRIDPRKCALCGEWLPLDMAKQVQGATGLAVCDSCMSAAVQIQSGRKQEKESVPDLWNTFTPQMILDSLNRSIIGQPEAKQALAVALWKQQLRARGSTDVPRSPLLLYGPTGCGKTALVRQAAKIVGLPFLNFDATSLSEAGYRGRDAADMVEDLVKAHPDHPQAGYGVIFIDELDKLTARGGEQRAAYSRGTQHSLLKLIEGMQVTTQSGLTVNTENIQFVFGGAFTGLDKLVQQRAAPVRTIGFNREEAAAEKSPVPTTEDFVAYGMEPELMGRITRRIQLHPLTRDQLRQVLLDSELSVYRKYQAFFKARGASLTVSPRCVEEWLDRAEKLQTGARGLQSAVEEELEPALLRLANADFDEEQEAEDVAENEF